MSKLNYKGQLIGAMGPVYFRMLNNQMIMQTKPGKGKVKQGTRTKQNATEFGRTSRAGKHIRMGLQDILQGWHDSTMFSRFTGQLYAAVKADQISGAGKRHLAAGDLSLLQGFEFNSASFFINWSTMFPTVSRNANNTLKISLNLSEGAAAAKPYSGASGCEAVVLAAVFDSETLVARQEQFIYKYDKAHSETGVSAWQTPVIPANSIVMVAVALLYYRMDGILGKRYLNGKDFHPCLLVSGILM